MTGTESLLQYGTARGRWVILATVLGSSMAMLDSTVVGIALPVIGREFDAGINGLQWAVNAYTLTLAGFLLQAGALADRLGRKRVFLVGVVWFATASLICAVAWSVEALIAARALQGVGAALLTPGSLAILQASFAPKDRAKAIGAWSGLGGVAAAAGPFLGGYLVDQVSWRWIFLINLPLALAVIAVTIRHVPETRDPASEHRRVDVAGALLAPIGLAGLTYGLIEGPARGWASPVVLSCLLGGIGMLLLFVLVEFRTRDPLLPMDVFKSTQFSAANLVTLLVYGALGGALFLLPIALQQGAGYSPIQAGTALLPFTLLMLALSARMGALASRIGPRLPMTVGPIVAGAGLALMARIDQDGDYLTQVLPAVLVFGFGMTITVAPLTATVLAAVPDEHAGVASAVNNDVARVAGLLAVAILPPAAGLVGEVYLDPGRFTDGFHTAVLLAAACCALGGVVAAIWIRNPERVPEEVVPERHHSHCALDAPPLRTPEAAGVAQR
jgi:EmrB/QacA subfamily drug resistance transporter